MKVVLIAGSNRRLSASTKMCRYIEQELQALGCTTELYDLYSRPLPIYSPDEDEIKDSHVLALKQAMFEAEAVVLATGEYHGGMTGALKNALDYLGFEHFDSKMVLAVSASGGAVGISALQQIQTTVRYVHGINCPEWISIGGSNRSFLPDGEPESAPVKERVKRVVRYFAETARLLCKKAE
jgi:azobenzene reductase